MLIFNILVRPVNQQLLHDLRVPVRSRQVQWSLPFAVFQIVLFFGMGKNKINHLLAPHVRSPVQRSTELVVPRIDGYFILVVDEGLHFIALGCKVEDTETEFRLFFVVSPLILQIPDDLDVAFVGGVVEGGEAIAVFGIDPFGDFFFGAFEGLPAFGDFFGPLDVLSDDVGVVEEGGMMECGVALFVFDLEEVEGIGFDEEILDFALPAVGEEELPFVLVLGH